jgi:hypothetical protein
MLYRCFRLSLRGGGECCQTHPGHLWGFQVGTVVTSQFKGFLVWDSKLVTKPSNEAELTLCSL